MVTLSIPDSNYRIEYEPGKEYNYKIFRDHIDVTNTANNNLVYDLFYMLTIYRNRVDAIAAKLKECDENKSIIGDTKFTQEMLTLLDSDLPDISNERLMHRLNSAEDLLKQMFAHVRGEETIEDTINYVLCNFNTTEEELVELGLCTEEDIDRANASLMSSEE